MKKLLNKNTFIYIALIILLTLSFSINIFGLSISISTFKNFQMDSENLVFAKMYIDGKDDIKNEFKYGLAMYDNYTSVNIFQKADDVDANLTEYKSQVGLQGYIFSFLYNVLHIPFFILKLFSCMVLAIVLFCICYFISKKYNKTLGIIFYITFLLSPWVVFFAKNLYWVEFTWFLPCLLGLLLSMNYNKKRIFVPLIFIAILIKCMCGYEYISVIMLATIIFFIIDFFLEKDKEKKKKIFFTTLIVGVICLLAFMTVIIIHGAMRGNGNIIEGIKDIYQQDVLRRTILTYDKDNYEGLVKESMDASVINVLERYVYNWYSDIILGIDCKLFPLIIISSLIICIVNFIQKKENSKRDILMYIGFGITCISWFILGKSHSYIHMWLNHVLWYFGYVQICLYIIFEFICDGIRKIKNN